MRDARSHGHARAQNASAEASRRATPTDDAPLRFLPLTAPPPLPLGFVARLPGPPIGPGAPGARAGPLPKQEEGDVHVPVPYGNGEEEMMGDDR